MEVALAVRPATQTTADASPDSCAEAAQAPGATAAADAQHDEADPGAAAASTCRWLACTFKADVLGVAAYDRLSNEVRHVGSCAQCSAALC